MKGLESLGAHCGEIPRNCSTSHTCGHCCFGCPSGDKQDGTGTYLSDAAGHGARMLTGQPHQLLLCPSIHEKGFESDIFRHAGTSKAFWMVLSEHFCVQASSQTRSSWKGASAAASASARLSACQR